VDARTPTPPFGNDGDVNSSHGDPFRPSSVQEIIERKSGRLPTPMVDAGGDTLLPEIHRGKNSDPQSSSIPMVVQDTVNLLEQLDGPSRQLPGGTKPSAERPVASQDGPSLAPGHTHSGIPKLNDNHQLIGGLRVETPSRCGGVEQLASFGITRKRNTMREPGSPFSPPKSPTSQRMAKHRSPPRLRQAISGTAFTGCRPDQPYFPFLLSTMGNSRTYTVRESVVRDQLKDYAMLAVAWQRSRAGVSLAPKSLAVQHAEARFALNSKRAMMRELKQLHIGDYHQQIYRRTHVVDPGDAGLVFFKMAVAYDELQDTKNALRCAKLYLNVCRQMGDPVGEALACNTIGVQLQALGGHKNLQKAVSYHSLHLQNGDDLGRFIAYVNLGQVYRDMDMMAQSRESALKALEAARKAYSAFGESIACAQLGTTMAVVGDPAASRQFLSKYLELAGSMSNAESEEDAWTQLGQLLSAQKELTQASECYEHAFHLSMALPNRASNHARAMLGVTKGDQLLGQQMREISQQMRKY